MVNQVEINRLAPGDVGLFPRREWGQFLGQFVNCVHLLKKFGLCKTATYFFRLRCKNALFYPETHFFMQSWIGSSRKKCIEQQKV